MALCMNFGGGGGGGQRPEFNFFSEYVHVAYQIKGNESCINREADILSTDPLRPCQ